MSQQDYRSEIDQWADMWDEMQKSNVHPPMEKPQPSPWAAEVLGTKAQDTYYDYLDAQDDYAPEPEESYDGEALLAEQKKRRVQQQRQQPAARRRLREDKTPNPVYPDSQGNDNEQPQAVWVTDKLLQEVESLKKRLFAVENKMARLGQGKKFSEKAVIQGSEDGKALMSEIKNLRKRIDRVSSSLGIKDEESPWQVKRD